MSNYIIWKRKRIKDCSPEELSACLKFCWDGVSSRKRKMLKKKLTKLVIIVAKEKLKQIDRDEI
jgi:hypothetical protein